MSFSRRQYLILFTLTLVSLAWLRSAHAEMLMVPTDREARVVDEIGMPERRLIRAPRPADLPFRVTQSRVDVRIEENVATTTLTQTFLNLSGRQLEVRVMVPLPADATINRSALSMGDEMVQGKLYNAAEAQQIYETIVSSRRDPALLRFVGENLYEARVFPIEPNQERSLQFSFTQVLAPVGGLYDFRHILAGSQLYRTGVEKFQFECVIRGASPLGPVYSPSHLVSVDRPDPKSATIKFKEDFLASDRDFRLYYAPTADDVALRILTHRPKAEEDGYFMLLVRPGEQLDTSKVLPKEIVFVLDTSGSMAGEKMEQAKAALNFCLNQLNPRDRFNLVPFSTEVKSFNPKLLEATKENVQKALAYVDALEATGGTNIDDALRTALENDFTAGPASAKLVIFLTDGKPSVGITDIKSILKDVENSNGKPQARVFAFGVGTDVNTHLLDRLVMDAAGTCSYVAPKEDLELKVSDFYAKIKNPVMTDLALDLGPSARVHSLYPKKLPALFKGNELLVFGRYKGTGSGDAVLTGNVAGEKREIRLPVVWAEADRGNDFLPRVWAMRKIGHLLEELRLGGPNQELIEEVVALAQQHGIVTPYTSQLVLEPGMDPNAIRDGRWRGRLTEETAALAPGAPTASSRELLDGANANLEGLRKEAEQRAGQAVAAKSGDLAVSLAEAEKQLKDAQGDAGFAARAPKPAETGEALDDKSVERRFKSDSAARELKAQAYAADRLAQQSGGAGGKVLALDGDEAKQLQDFVETSAEMTIKQAAGRAFYLRQNVWVDGTMKLKDGEEPVKLEAFGKEYFELLKKHPELGAVFALGDDVLVSVDGKAYRVVPPAAKK
ncbi:MAG: VWA domain-containing protein [Planctomycetes bacterium]|nr:VWA domain-containing protein [Planctomycetota bacterium]